MSSSIRVWDLPTRLFHWLLLVCVAGLVVSSQIGGDAMMWHFRFGYAVLTLLLFRLVWGLVGGRWSRFVHFAPTPARLLTYWRGGHRQAAIGHNPLGALSVFAMLGILLLQVGTGLVSDDEIANAGPLSHLVSSALSSTATSYHKTFGKLALLTLIALHVAAILYYQLRLRHRLVQAMLHGDQISDHASPPSRDDWRTRLLALVLFAGCGTLVYAMLQWTARA